MSSQKTAVDNPSKLEPPVLQTYDSHHDLIVSECMHRTSNRQNKARISRNSDFLW